VTEDWFDEPTPRPALPPFYPRTLDDLNARHSHASLRLPRLDLGDWIVEPVPGTWLRVRHVRGNASDTVLVTELMKERWLEPLRHQLAQPQLLFALRAPPDPAMGDWNKTGRITVEAGSALDGYEGPLDLVHFDEYGAPHPWALVRAWRRAAGRIRWWLGNR
jgi:hypothetical protein